MREPLGFAVLHGVDNHWRRIARERLDAEAKGAMTPEMVLQVDVAGRTMDVLITLEDLRAVRESARRITKAKIAESFEAVHEADAGHPIAEDERPAFAREVFRTKAVHEREFLRTYAFWKAVEIMARRQRPARRRTGGKGRR